MDVIVTDFHFQLTFFQMQTTKIEKLRSA